MATTRVLQRYLERPMLYSLTAAKLVSGTEVRLLYVHLLITCAELWGWLTPSGYCQNGVCTASIKALGDPMY